VKRTFIALAAILAALAIGVAEPAYAKKCRGMSVCQLKKPVEDTGEAVRRAAEAAREATRKAEEAAREAARKTEEAALEAAKQNKLLRDAAELAQKVARERDEAAQEIRRREEKAAQAAAVQERALRQKAEERASKDGREFNKAWQKIEFSNTGERGGGTRKGDDTIKDGSEEKGDNKPTKRTETQQPSPQERQQRERRTWPQYRRDHTGPQLERRRDPTYHQKPRSTMEHDSNPANDLPEQSEPGYPRQPNMRPQGPARIYTR
jgi:colicin import membrane protein